jgi:hypothetical protein
MRTRAGLIFLAIITFLAVPVDSQTSETTLVMSAHWDNHHPIDGTVTLVKASQSKEDATIVAKKLSEGLVTVTVPLAENALYNITLLAPDGKELLKFPITTALINPKNLVRGQIDIVCRTSDHSVASAQISVLMNF